MATPSNLKKSPAHNAGVNLDRETVGFRTVRTIEMKSDEIREKIRWKGWERELLAAEIMTLKCKLEEAIVAETAEVFEYDKKA